MGAIAMAAVVFVVAAWLAIRRWQRHGESATFALRVLPAALLFAVAPVPVGAFALTRGFQSIAEAGVGGLPLVASFVQQALESLLVGVLLAVLAIAGAAALQAFATGDRTGDDEARVAAAPPDPVAVWLQVGAAALIVPAAMAVLYARGTTGFVVEVGTALAAASAGAAGTPATADVSATAAQIAERVVAAQMYGGLFAVVLMLMTGAVASFGQSRREPQWLRTCSWAAVAVSVTLGLTGSYLLMRDLRTVDRLVADDRR